MRSTIIVRNGNAQALCDSTWAGYRANNERLEGGSGAATNGQTSRCSVRTTRIYGVDWQKCHLTAIYGVRIAQNQVRCKGFSRLFSQLENAIRFFYGFICKQRAGTTISVPARYALEPELLIEWAQKDSNLQPTSYASHCNFRCPFRVCGLDSLFTPKGTCRRVSTPSSANTEYRGLARDYLILRRRLPRI